MSERLHILILEDVATDAELVERELRKAGVVFITKRVETREAFLKELKDFAPNLILADYSLPQFDGMSALEIVKEQYPDVPFILISGTIGEEFAIEALKAGATDYVLKQRLSRLVPAVHRALSEAEERAKLKRADEALRESEERFRAIFDNAPDGILLADVETKKFFSGNKMVCQMLGYSQEEIKGLGIMDIHPKENLPYVLEQFEKQARREITLALDIPVKRRDSSIFYADINSFPMTLAGKAYIVGIFRDITERKKAEEQIQRKIQHIKALRNIDMAITASLDLRVTLNVLLEQVTTQLSVDAATVLLLNPNTLTLEYATRRGFRSHALRHTYLRLGEGQAGRAALERRIVIVPNLSEAKTTFSSSPLLAGEGFISYYAVPLIAKGNVKGVLEIFHRDTLYPDQEWLDFLEALATQAAIAVDNASLFDDLQRSNIELILAYDSTLEGWSKALDMRDKETEGHSQRVTEMTIKIAKAMGISETELVHIRRGALLHDIGKMGIPDSILLKPGPLTDEEWEIMYKHPVYAYEMLSSIAFLRPALDIPYYHHEKWDGTGYPRGLKGEQIPLSARIFALVDVRDALNSERPYRPAWPEGKVYEYIREHAGKHFDPKVVKVFLETLKP